MIQDSTLPRRYTTRSDAEQYIADAGCKLGHEMTVTEVTPDLYGYYLSLYGIDKPGIYVMDNRDNKLVI